MPARNRSLITPVVVKNRIRAVVSATKARWRVGEEAGESFDIKGTACVSLELDRKSPCRAIVSATTRPFHHGGSPEAHGNPKARPSV
jgi:hypothetical protein